MNNDKLKQAGVAIFVGVLILGAIYFYMRSEGIVEDTAILGAGVEEAAPTVSSGTPASGEQKDASKSPDVKADTEAPKQDEKPVELTEHEKFKEEQKKLLSKFQTETHMTIKLPENMNYTELDMEDGIAGLYGSHPEANQKVAIFAGKATGSAQAIAQFLNEEKGAIPFLKDTGFSIKGEVQKLQAPQGSGFGAVTIIPGPEQSGLQTVAAHVERADGKGSYLFVMQANPNMFESNDEGFEAILKTAKANP